MKNLLWLLVTVVGSAFGADVTGTWKATTEYGDRTFTFKVDGNKVTGDSSAEGMGKSTINDGKIDGDNLSFVLMVNYQGTEYKVLYKGSVTGSEMKMHVETSDGSYSADTVAKKVS